MERFPCGENKNTENCYVFKLTGECFEDIHHKRWPKAEYKKGLRRRFRELDENKEITCRDHHNEKHATEGPPPIPSVEFMRNALKRAKK